MLIHDRVDPGCEGGDFPLTAIDLGGRRIRPSTRALELIRSLEDEAGSLCDPVGCNARYLDRSSSQASEVGALVADALLGAFDSVDIALQNSGGLRAGLPAGVVRREHLHALMPFENRAVLLEMNGEELELLLRLGSSGGHGIFQVAGGRYSYDPGRTAGSDLDGDGRVENWERNRLCSATVAGEPLDPSRIYRVVVNDFLFAGGDHAGPAFAEGMLIEEGPLVRDTLRRHIQSLEGCLGESETPEEPRISVGACG